MPSTDEIDEDFEKILNDDTRYMTKQEMRMRQLIDERFAQANFVSNTPICEIGGDQTKEVNLNILDAQVRHMNERLEELQTQLRSLSEQFAHIETESLPEDVKRKFKRIENQIRELRDSGITATSSQYVRGLSYDSHEPFDPTKQSSAICNFTYGEEVHADLLNELKKRQIEMGIRDQPTVMEVDVEFDKIQFDDSKCMEAIMVKGRVEQCPEFKFGNTNYCQKHQKKR